MKTNSSRVDVANFGFFFYMKEIKLKQSKIFDICQSAVLHPSWNGKLLLKVGLKFRICWSFLEPKFESFFFDFEHNVVYYRIFLHFFFQSYSRIHKIFRRCAFLLKLHKRKHIMQLFYVLHLVF